MRRDSGHNAGVAPHALDAVIIGGGPAGAAAARLLAAWGHSVQLLTRTVDPSRYLGESLPPSCRKLFDLLGATRTIDAAGFLESTGNTAWSATMRPARVAGLWLLRGQAHGIGPVYGQVTITAVPGTVDEFTTETSYVFARDGRRVTREGRAIIYTSFQWRGRSSEGPDDPEGLREVMFVERDWQTMSGRWFTGAYDEVGLDVTLERVTTAAIVAGVSPPALRVGAAETIRVYGMNLLSQTRPGAVDVGPGIEVIRIVETTSDRMDIEVRVDAAAAVGQRDLFLDQAARPGAVTVYDTVHRVAVTPQAGMARVGGVRSPRQYQQFEARAFYDGPDGESDTDDDLDLGVVDVAWTLEEHAATFGDDDSRFVGAIDARGRFTRRSMDRTSSEAATGTTSVTFESSRRTRVRRTTTRCAPVRICSSPCRSICGGTRPPWSNHEPASRPW